ncbi:MAG: prepilin-type N-terminal cleavage/methylation domain-containing protein [Opitutaceae bacterium]|jgi:prepilin-type N-terminal cleavage/methylation domain-containing protein/prepilin-type processing-associated H-X9-DG protein|nr:prepilin-type N-terminal cleavage/methylation domain-containing protein [Opitutaceae bacterium]
MKPPSIFSRSRAFTLIELLAVIVIIGILASIIIPVAARVRSIARTVRCVTNMRQYLTALPMFAADHRGLVPECYQNGSATAEARTQLAPYFSPPPGLAEGSNELFRWAAKVANCTTTTQAADPERSWVFGFNSWTGQKANYGPALPLASFTEPSRLIYIIDTTGSRAIRPETFSGSNPKDFQQAAPRPHNGKVNVGYMDGHVKTRIASTLYRADFTRGTPGYGSSHETQKVATTEYDR